MIRYQLEEYVAAAASAPRKFVSRVRSNSVTQAVITATITNRAGSSRRARRAQKSARATRPRAVHCPSSRSVIR